MTEKRYYNIITTGHIKDELTGELLKGSAIGDRLNEQHEQIEDLKDANVRCCNEYSYFHKRMMELEKENEQLKFENSKLIVDKNGIQGEYEWLKEENEQFKKEIQFYYDTTNDNGKQIISDLVDMLEMKGMNVDWMKKRW